MNRTILISILATIIFSCSKKNERSCDLVIQNVGFFDGSRDHGNVNLGIINDTIAFITTEPILSDSIIDGTNQYILPGLINSHVHAISPENLKDAMNSGIMAVVDLHKTSEEVAKKLRTYRDSLNYSYFISSGHAATVPAGHPTQFGKIETINDSLSPKEWVQNRLENGADLIKIIWDPGGGPGDDFQEIPTLSFDQIGEIIHSAKESEKMTISHTVKLEAVMAISDLGIDGFAHLWFYNDSINDDQLNMLVRAKNFVIPTAQTQVKIWEKVSGSSSRIKEYAADKFSSMELVRNQILRLHQAGVTILAGNDPPNFGINYGDDFLEELLIYQNAGLSNSEVLRTATGNPSKIFDLNGIGRIEIGQKANMILIDGNPLEELSALKRIRHIWKNGKKIK